MFSDGLKVLPLTERTGSDIEILIDFLIKILIHFLRRFGMRFVADHAGGHADDERRGMSVELLGFEVVQHDE